MGHRDPHNYVQISADEMMLVCVCVCVGGGGGGGGGGGVQYSIRASKLILYLNCSLSGIFYLCHT